MNPTNDVSLNIKDEASSVDEGSEKDYIQNKENIMEFSAFVVALKDGEFNFRFYCINKVEEMALLNQVRMRLDLEFQKSINRLNADGLYPLCQAA